METNASTLALEPKTASVSNLCPIGFVVYPGGEVDASRGCGYRRCHPSACEYVRRLNENEGTQCQ